MLIQAVQSPKPLLLVTKKFAYYNIESFTALQQTFWNTNNGGKDGLTFRPLEETLLDALKFDKSRKDYTLRAGLKPEREAEIIKKFESL